MSIRSYSLIAALALVLPLAAGCPDPGVGNTDGGGSADAASADPDAGGTPPADGGAGGDDAGSGADDAGSTAEDAGSDAGALDGGVDAGSAMDAGPTCVMNSECALGEVCKSGGCVAGCDDGRDCPGTAAVCDTSAGTYGACVQCVDAMTDCDTGEVCDVGVCRTGCTAGDPTCPGGTVCDTTAEVCVECLDDGNCGVGTICEDRACVDGCRDDRDCPEGTICNDVDTCVDGCTVSPDSCPLGAHCDAVTQLCILGCNDDDARCPMGEVCNGDGACAPGCSVDGGPCPPGSTCSGDVCVPGCAVNEDCGLITATPICDTTGGSPGACVGCLVADDCPGQNLVCHPGNHCVADCDNQSAANLCSFAGNICDAAGDNLCVECLDNDDCGGGETCDLTTNLCVVTPVDELCATCAGDDECAGDALCVTLTALGGDPGCATDCSADDVCPSGFSCEFVGDPVRGKVCRPASTVVDDPTCAAYRAAVAGSPCGAFGNCGVPFVNDGVCANVDDDPDDECTLACSTASDCPADFTCEPAPASSGLPGLCTPQ
jgi:Cys-rich repeat protein